MKSLNECGNSNGLSFRPGVQQQEEPLQVISNLFCEMNLNDVWKQLDNLLYVAITRDSTEFNSGIKRDAAIHFCKKMKELAEAAYVLNSKKRK